MAVCTDDPGNHKAHCFHAHFLLCLREHEMCLKRDKASDGAGRVVL